jgi:hypothetical protein
MEHSCGCFNENCEWLRAIRLLCGLPHIARDMRGSERVALLKVCIKRKVGRTPRPSDAGAISLQAGHVSRM